MGQGGASAREPNGGGREEVDVALKEALLDSFSAASRNRERYEVYSARAEAQQYPQLARLFRAAALGEALHAQRHLKAAREVGSPARNLAAALAVEAADAEERYPQNRRLAAQAGNKRADQAFEFAEGVDRLHHQLFQEAVAFVNEGRDLPAQEYLLCKVCGYLQLGSTPPDFCPVCGSPAEVFSPVQ